MCRILHAPAVDSWTWDKQRVSVPRCVATRRSRSLIYLKLSQIREADTKDITLFWMNFHNPYAWKHIWTLFTNKLVLPWMCLFIRCPVTENVFSIVSFPNEFSYESSGFQLENKNKSIVYRQMVSLQNEFSYESSDFLLENDNKSIVYRQMVSLQNELSYESSGFQL